MTPCAPRRYTIKSSVDQIERFPAPLISISILSIFRGNELETTFYTGSFATNPVFITISPNR